VLACLVLLGLLALLLPERVRPGPDLTPKTSRDAEKSDESGKPPEPGESDESRVDKDLAKKETSPPLARPPRPTSPEEIVRARLEGAVLLIEVEKVGHFMPFATCCALNENTVLTTAREAYQLSQWLKDLGVKLWVTNPATGLKSAVKDIRVHKLFATLGSKPGDWIYCDLALVTVDGQLPKTAALASAEELSRLKDGHRLFCYGFTHEGYAVTAEDRLDPVLTPCRVFIITAHRTLPGQPSVLHLMGDLPKSAYGSPIADEQGNVVAIYGEAAAQPGSDAKASASPLKLHYAPVVNPEVVEMWLKKADSKIWIPAADLKAPDQAPRKAKTDR